MRNVRNHGKVDFYVPVRILALDFYDAKTNKAVCQTCTNKHVPSSR